MTRLFKGIAAAILAMCSLGAPLSAQTTPQVVTQFDDATIARLLLSVQARWQTQAGQQGQVIYRASAEGGVNFTVMTRACSAEQGCLGLLVMANFTGVEADNEGTLDAFLHRFNDTNPSAKVYRVSGTGVVLQSYLNAAGGISFANAQAQLLVFGQDLVALRTELTALDAAR